MKRRYPIITTVLSVLAVTAGAPAAYAEEADAPAVSKGPEHDIPHLQIVQAGYGPTLAPGIYETELDEWELTARAQDDDWMVSCGAFTADSFIGIREDRRHNRTYARHTVTAALPLLNASRPENSGNALCATSLAFDPARGLFDAFCLDDQGIPSLRKLDMTTLAPTDSLRAWAYDFSPVAMTRDNEGTLYCLGDDGIFYRADSHSTLTAVGPLGFTPSHAVQSACYDAANNRILWAAQGNTPGLYAVNISTGKASILHEFYRGEQIAAMQILNPQGLPRVPMAPRAPEFEGDIVTGNGNVILTLPAQYGDRTQITGYVTAALYIDGRGLGTVTGVAGSQVSKAVELTPGTHHLAARAINHLGCSSVAYSRIFTGIAAPAAPSNVYISYSGTRVNISWDAVRSDINGRPLSDSDVTYSLVRQPENITVSNNLRHTYAEDYLSANASRMAYYYEVRAVSNKIKSEPALTERAVIGSSYIPDMSIDFRDADQMEEFETMGSHYGWQRAEDGALISDDKVQELSLPLVSLNPQKKYSLELDLSAIGGSAEVTAIAKSVYNDIDIREIGAASVSLKENTHTPTVIDFTARDAGMPYLVVEFRMQGGVRISGFRILDCGYLRGPDAVSDITMSYDLKGKPSMEVTLPECDQQDGKIEEPLQLVIDAPGGSRQTLYDLQPGNRQKISLIANHLTEEYVITPRTPSYTGRKTRITVAAAPVNGSFSEDFSDTSRTVIYTDSLLPAPILAIKGGKLRASGGNSSETRRALIPFPHINLNADSLYEVTVKGRASGARLHLLACEGSHTDTLGTIGEDDCLSVLTDAGNGKSFRLAVDASRPWNLSLDAISVNSYASLQAPSAVTRARAAALADEGHEARLCFTAPLKNIGGEDLSEKMQVMIRRSGDALPAVTLADIAPGDSISWTDCGLPAGDNEYVITAINAAGPGLTATAAAYAGKDTPGCVRNMSAQTESGASHRALIRWEAPESGIHGMKIPKENLSYNIYIVQQEAEESYMKLLDSGITEESYVAEVAVAGQERQSFAVTAVNRHNEGEASVAATLLGKPLFPGFTEPFALGTTATSLWDTGNHWRIDASVSAGVVTPDNGAAICVRSDNKAVTDSVADMLLSPLLDMHIMETLTLTLQTYTTASGMKHTIAIVDPNGKILALPATHTVGMAEANTLIEWEVELTELLKAGIAGFDNLRIGILSELPADSGNTYGCLLVDTFTLSGTSGVPGIRGDNEEKTVGYDLLGRPAKGNKRPGTLIIRNGKKIFSR